MHRAPVRIIGALLALAACMRATEDCNGGDCSAEAAPITPALPPQRLGGECSRRGEIVCSQEFDSDALECDGSAYRPYFTCPGLQRCGQIRSGASFSCGGEPNAPGNVVLARQGNVCVVQSSASCSLNRDSVLYCNEGRWEQAFDCAPSQCVPDDSIFGYGCANPRIRQQPGEPCNRPGTLVCDGVSEAQVLVCQDEVYRQAFQCPGISRCQETRGLALVLCGAGTDDPNALPLSRTGGACASEGVASCSVDLTQVLSCRNGVWTESAACDEPCTRNDRVLNCGEQTLPADMGDTGNPNAPLDPNAPGGGSGGPGGGATPGDSGNGAGANGAGPNGACADNGVSCPNDPGVVRETAECMRLLSQGSCYCAAAETYECFLRRGCYAEAGAATELPRATLEAGIRDEIRKASEVNYPCDPTG